MKRPIVSNAGPLIALSVIGKLEILNTLFQPIMIPSTVNQEILSGGDKWTGMPSFKDAAWLRVQACHRSKDPLLPGMLHQGEADVIRLARQLDIRYVLIDEAKARKIARDIYGLKVIGTARVLVEAKKNGLIENVERELRSMQARGYWIAEKIVCIACKEAGEESP